MGLQSVHVHIPFDWVGGGILVHGITPLHHWVESVGGSVTMALINGVLGVVAGAVVLGVISLASKIWKTLRG